MDPNLEGFFDRFQALIDDCKVQIAGLTQTELHWSPGESMNSLAVLAAHTAGAARFWMMDVVMGQATGRDRDQEFAVSGQNTEALAGLLDSSLADLRRAFEILTPNQLAEMRTSPRDGRKYTVAWSIAHILEHTALHLGHMQITRQWLESLTKPATPQPQ